MAAIWLYCPYCAEKVSDSDIGDDGSNELSWRFQCPKCHVLANITLDLPMMARFSPPRA